MNALQLNIIAPDAGLKGGLHGMISPSDWVGAHMGCAFGRVTAILRRATAISRAAASSVAHQVPQHPVAQPRFEARATEKDRHSVVNRPGEGVRVRDDHGA
jgi:hypothetical protein